MGKGLRRTHAVALLVVLAVAAAGLGSVMKSRAHSVVSVRAKLAAGEAHFGSQGQANGNGDESAELLKGQQQYDDQRLAPNGILNPGAYTAAFGRLTSLSAAGGRGRPAASGGGAGPAARGS